MASSSTLESKAEPFATQRLKGRQRLVKPRTAPLKATVRTGSRTMKKVFSNDEAVFSHNDVPAAARDAKSSVRQWKKPNILHTTKVEWNTSTVTPEKLCKRSNRQLAVHDRREFAYNYRAEVLPEPVELVQDGFVFPRVRSALAATKRAEEMPVNPKLLDKPTWDNSTSVDFKEKEFKLADQDAAAQRAGMRKSAQLKAYVDPVSQEKEFLETLRAARERGEEYPKPAAAAPELAAKPVTVSYTSTVSRKFKKYSHTGTFEKTQFSKNKVWSCCMSEDPDGRGCIVTTVNPDAYNFVSIN